MNNSEITTRLAELVIRADQLEAEAAASRTASTDALYAEARTALVSGDYTGYAELLKTRPEVGTALSVVSAERAAAGYRNTVYLKSYLVRVTAKNGGKFREAMVSPAGFHPDDGVYLPARVWDADERCAKR